MEKEINNVEEKTKKSLFKKILNILGYVLIGILLVFDAFALISKIQMQGEEGGMNLFGNEVRLVLTGSMDGSDEFYNLEENKDLEIKRIEVHDAIFVKRVPTEEDKAKEFYESLKVGDILTFYYQLGRNIPVTHRIIQIDNKGDYYSYTLRGDNPSGDEIVSKYSPTQKVNSDTGLIIGKVTGVNKVLGNVLYVITEKKIVLVLLVVIPSGLFTLYEIGKVFFIIYKNKQDQKNEKIKIEKEKEQTIKDTQLLEKDEELQRLKEELERLKGGGDDK